MTSGEKQKRNSKPQVSKSRFEWSDYRAEVTPVAVGGTKLHTVPTKALTQNFKLVVIGSIFFNHKR